LLFRRLNLESNEGGWLFTTEILFMAEQLGFEIIEIPVKLQENDSKPTNLNLGDPFRMFIGLLRIKCRSGKK
jgi:dolichyl-phosphate beta-glucosyltransferase